MNSGIAACLRPPHIALGTFSGKGRGVVATRSIAKGDVIEESPVIILTPAALRILEATSLWPYWFEWIDPALPHPHYQHLESQKHTEAPQVIPLGLISLANHSDKPNTKIQRNFTAKTLSLIATRPIAAQEEITYDYECELWFKIT